MTVDQIRYPVRRNVLTWVVKKNYPRDDMKLHSNIATVVFGLGSFLSSETT